MHSFGMTDRYAVLAEFPLLLNPLKLAAGSAVVHRELHLEARAGTRFLVIDRHTGGVKMRATADRFSASTT